MSDPAYKFFAGQHPREIQPGDSEGWYIVPESEVAHWLMNVSMDASHGKFRCEPERLYTITGMLVPSRPEAYKLKCRKCSRPGRVLE